MEQTLDLKMIGIFELGKETLIEVDGGELTRDQEIWVERGIAFLLLGVVGVAIYELGRQNG